MAAHIPIETTYYHRRLTKDFLSRDDVKRAGEFERIPLGNDSFFPYYMKLTSDYYMNEYHGLEDKEVFSLTTEDEILEIHLDEDKNINQVYQVL